MCNKFETRRRRCWPKSFVFFSGFVTVIVSAVWPAQADPLVLMVNKARIGLKIHLEDSGKIDAFCHDFVICLIFFNHSYICCQNIFMFSIFFLFWPAILQLSNILALESMRVCRYREKKKTPVAIFRKKRLPRAATSIQKFNNVLHIKQLPVKILTYCQPWTVDESTFAHVLFHLKLSS